MKARQSLLTALVSLFTLSGAVPLGAQQLTGRIEGTVTDARSNQPLVSASVFIQGSGVGSQTNDRGRFVLVNVPVGDQRISVRRIGFNTMQKTVTVTAGQTVTVDFAMSEAAISLDEVVVTGTAIATRAKEVPTSTDVVNMQSLQNAPVANAQQILAGRVPSVTIQANSGQPGAGGSIRIRGTNTITQSVEPLIYVDGVRIFNELTRNNWGARTASSPLQDINPDDIERVEVVKGAAATTLYGTEASGGVIQIFTKKGLAGAPEWNTNITTGFNTNSQWGSPDDPTALFTKCSMRDQMYTIGTSSSNRGERIYFVDPTCPTDGDWTDPGPIQQYDLSVRGGNQKVTYFLSGNYGNIAGILPTQKSKDGGFRGNFAFFPVDQLQLSLNTSYVRRNTRWAGDGNNAEGFLLNVGRGWRGYMAGGKGTQCDPWAGTDTVCVANELTFEQNLTTRSDHFLSGVTLNYTPSEHFSNRFSVGWDYTDMQNVTNLPFGFKTTPGGYFWDENSRHTKLSLDYAGSLQNAIGRFSLQNTFSWGGQLFRDRHRWTEIDVEPFAGPGDPTLETGASITYRRDRPQGVTNAGFFFQEQLAWKDRLFLTGGLRVDGNSAFGEDFGLQTYPKLGLSYVLSEYDFWPKNLVQTFKIRGAVGESGKAPGAFDKLRTWDPVTGDENQPGFEPGNVGAKDLGPERTREFEMGFDASFLDGRLGSEVTYYSARTFDALVPVTRPPSGGFSNAQLQNVGELRNSGAEVQLTASVLRLGSFDWRMRGNMSRMWNRAVDLGELTEVYTGLSSYIREGQAFPRYYGLKITNPDAIADPETVDDAPLGNVNPDRLWGLGSTMTFFNKVTLDAFLEHQGNFVVQNYTAYQNARRGAWHPCYAAQEAMYGGGDPSNLTALERGRCSFSDYDIGYWTDPGDFTKLRYVSLTYDLPGRFLRANRASVTLSGRNLITWTKYTGADPEVTDVADQGNLVGFGQSFGRRDYYQIPQNRTFTISLRASF